ncbi:MAG TPA: hypothetical protein DCQ97_11105 [Chitinophagaceae bacterium]|nr:hypothetical protein [Chitinophagaceae bacterium]
MDTEEDQRYWRMRRLRACTKRVFKGEGWLFMDWGRKCRDFWAGSEKKLLPLCKQLVNIK